MRVCFALNIEIDMDAVTNTAVREILREAIRQSLMEVAVKTKMLAPMASTVDAFEERWGRGVPGGVTREALDLNPKDGIYGSRSSTDT